MLTLYSVSIILLIHMDCAFQSVSHMNVRNLSAINWDSTAIEFSWSPPDVPTPNDVFYEIYVNGNVYKQTNKTTIIIYDLKLSTKYKVNVKIVDENCKRYSPGITIEAMTAGIGYNVRDLRQVSMYDGGIQVSWWAPAYYDSEALQYEIYLNGHFNQITNITQAVINNLDKFTQYKVGVITVNEMGTRDPPGITIEATTFGFGTFYFSLCKFFVQLTNKNAKL
uniref:Fibronectin type III domain n=1 Tax=Schistocephalus solidus TaxID=70667 RepID=A0A0X3PE67_SCHSO